MATRANHTTQYHINEDPYCYCPTCGGKHYTTERAGQRCNRGDLAPFIGSYCTGILIRSQMLNRQILTPDKTATS